MTLLSSKIGHMFRQRSRPKEMHKHLYVNLLACCYLPLRAFSFKMNFEDLTLHSPFFDPSIFDPPFSPHVVIAHVFSVLSPELQLQFLVLSLQRLVVEYEQPSCGH